MLPKNVVKAGVLGAVLKQVIYLYLIIFFLEFFAAVFLVFTVFWQQEVLGHPARRPRAAKDCKPLAKFKDDYSNNLENMGKNMLGLYFIAVVSKL